MRIITLEEHFATPRFLDGPGRELKDQALKYNSGRAINLRRASRGKPAAAPLVRGGARAKPARVASKNLE